MHYALCAWKTNTCFAFHAAMAVWDGNAITSVDLGTFNPKEGYPLPSIQTCTATVADDVVDLLTPYIAQSIVAEHQRNLLLTYAPWRGMEVITATGAHADGYHLPAGSRVRVLKAVRIMQPATTRALIPVRDSTGREWQIPLRQLRKPGEVPTGEEAMARALAITNSNPLGCWARRAATGGPGPHTTIFDWLTPAHQGMRLAKAG